MSLQLKKKYKLITKKGDELHSSSTLFKNEQTIFINNNESIYVYKKKYLRRILRASSTYHDKYKNPNLSWHVTV